MATTGTVIFKHEDDVHGMAIGPVWIADAEGKLQPHEVNGTKWFTLAYAEGLAKRLQLPLREQ